MKTKIFVTVGSTYPLDRLIKQVDELTLNKEYEIFAQIGESNFVPKNIKFKKFLNYEKIQKRINWADIVISHAGIGTIIDCLSQNKKIILFPRLTKFKEAVDNHQIEICEAFEKKYGIKWTQNEKEIEKLIKTAKIFKLKKEEKLVKEINGLVN